MASVWQSPPSGAEILNGSNQPWRRGDTAEVQLILSQPFDIALIGGVLPVGLFFNGATKRIQGVIEVLPKGITRYPVVFRATSSDTDRVYDRSFVLVVDPVDEEQHWSDEEGNDTLPNPPSGWEDFHFDDLTKVNGAHNGPINRGSGVTIDLGIVNPDQDPLVFKALGVMGPPGSFSGLPYGLEIDNRGRIIGSATVTGNEPGDYYFKVYARDPDDLARNPRGEGSPRTSEKIYRITIAQEIVLDARLSDTVRWETPAGSLGSTYETYPSHFAIKASPQYEVETGNSTETQMISYTLTPQSKPLPDGLLLDQLTGLILGRCPYVTINKTFEFTVEARVVFVSNEDGTIRNSTIASERTFSVTIRNLFNSDNVTSLYVGVPSPLRSKIAQWIWGNKAEDRDQNLEVGATYLADGVRTTFALPPKIPGKTVERLVVLENGVPTTRPYTRTTVNGQDYVVFDTTQQSQSNLSTWTTEGDGVWELESGNNSVIQTINGNPTVFYSDYQAFGKALSGTIKVAANAGDDDFIGFVVGYQPNDIFSNDTNFILIDWKKATSGGGWAGLAVSRVTKSLVGGGSAASWGHSSGLGVTELARANSLGSTGWVEGQTYSFNIEYGSTKLRIWVDGVLQFDINGVFEDGRFGFYNNSQGQVTYAGVASSFTAPVNGSTIKIYRYGIPNPNSSATRLTILGQDNLFRNQDQDFGKVKFYSILIVNGLYLPTNNLMDHLKDYHHPTSLRVGQLKSATARSPEGAYLYDVLYLEVLDPLKGAGGFDVQGREEVLPRYVAGQPQTAIPQWNLPKEKNQYYPSSVKNLRLDLINRTNRLQGSNGLGIMGREGLPLWMMTEQTLGDPNSVLGYQCAIELAYVRPGSGAGIVKTLTTAGINEDLQGSIITADRYLVNTNGFKGTTFYNDTDGDPWDDDSSEPFYFDIMTFDGPDNPDTPTTNYTTFDRSLQSESKYYKFPPGDR